MCDPLTAVVAGSAILGAGVSYSQGQSQKKAAAKANQQAETRAAADAQKQETDFNRANQKTPNIAALMQQNADAVGGGQSGTFLTGSQGVDINSLQLGKTTLLGG